MIKERRERTNAQETKDDVISKEMISHQKKEKRDDTTSKERRERERSKIQGNEKEEDVKATPVTVDPL